MPHLADPPSCLPSHSLLFACHDIYCRHVFPSNHLKQVCVVVVVVVIEREAAEKTTTLSMRKTEGARSLSAKRMAEP